MGVPEASSHSGHTGKTYGVTQPGRRWLAKLGRPSHHWASQRPTLYRVLCEALGQGGERAPAPSLVHISGGHQGVSSQHRRALRRLWESKVRNQIN